MTCGYCNTPLVGSRQFKFCSPACAGRATAKPRKVRPPGPGHRSGRDHPRYRGGLCFHDGRWIICCRDGTTMFFYRGVMAAQIGRLLRPDEIVHHINGNSSDDRPENLQIVTRSEHAILHTPERVAAQLDALAARGGRRSWKDAA